MHDEFYAAKINKLLLIFYMHAYAGFVLKLTASAGGKIAFPPYKGHCWDQDEYGEWYLDETSTNQCSLANLL